MFDKFFAIDEMSDLEFQNDLKYLSVWICQMVNMATKSELKGIADGILSIKNEFRYVSLVEQLFISDQYSYVKLVDEGSSEIAKRRKYLAG